MFCTATLAHPVAKLIRRIGPRLPLAGGVMSLGCGFMSFSFAEVGTSFVSGYLTGIILTAIGIASMVASLTTAIMSSVEVSQSGTASGINSATARTAILFSVGILGAIHIAQFESRASIGLDALNLEPTLESQMYRELPKMAAAEIPTNIDVNIQNAIHKVIEYSFMDATHVVTRIAGTLAILGALIAFVGIGTIRPRDGIESKA
jgi:hypothetical protein